MKLFLSSEPPCQQPCTSLLLTWQALALQRSLSQYRQIRHVTCSYDMRYASPVLVRCGSNNESVVKMEWFALTHAFPLISFSFISIHPVSFARRSRSCNQIVTLDVLGNVAVWSLTGGGVASTNSNGEFIPPPLACTMTLPPICIREGQDSTPPALVELQRMFQFKQQSSSVRTCTSNYNQFCALNTRFPSGPFIHRIPSLVYRIRLPPDYTRRALRRRHHKAKLRRQPGRGFRRGARCWRVLMS